jgi:PqqD family protein of HPr-rel-A system
MTASEISQVSGTTFRILHNCKLSWKFWDNEFVVYNPLSGDTHLLDRFSGEILKSLETKPASQLDLASRLNQESGMDLDEDLVKRIGELLLKFSELNLIEPL